MTLRMKVGGYGHPITQPYSISLGDPNSQTTITVKNIVHTFFLTKKVVGMTCTALIKFSSHAKKMHLIVYPRKSMNKNINRVKFYYFCQSCSLQYFYHILSYFSFNVTKTSIVVNLFTY